MDGWWRLMYVLSSRVSLEDEEGEEDEEEEEAGEWEAEGDRPGVAGLAARSLGEAEAVGETAIGAGATTCGATGLRVSHISQVMRLPALWYVQDGQIHSAEEAEAEGVAGEGSGG